MTSSTNNNNQTNNTTANTTQTSNTVAANGTANPSPPRGAAAIMAGRVLANQQAAARANAAANAPAPVVSPPPMTEKMSREKEAEKKLLDERFAQSEKTRQAGFDELIRKNFEKNVQEASEEALLTANGAKTLAEQATDKVNRFDDRLKKLEKQREPGSGTSAANKSVLDLIASYEKSHKDDLDAIRKLVDQKGDHKELGTLYLANTNESARLAKVVEDSGLDDLDEESRKQLAALGKDDGYLATKEVVGAFARMEEAQQPGMEVEEPKVEEPKPPKTKAGEKAAAFLGKVNGVMEDVDGAIARAEAFDYNDKTGEITVKKECANKLKPVAEINGLERFLAHSANHFVTKNAMKTQAVADHKFWNGLYNGTKAKVSALEEAILGKSNGTGDEDAGGDAGADAAPKGLIDRVAKLEERMDKMAKKLDTVDKLEKQWENVKKRKFASMCYTADAECVDLTVVLKKLAEAVATVSPAQEGAAPAKKAKRGNGKSK